MEKKTEKTTKEAKITKVKKEKTAKGKTTKKHGKIMTFFHEVKTEMKKVRFSTKKEMLTYSLATISFVLLFGTFFVLTDLILAGLKMLVA